MILLTIKLIWIVLDMFALIISLNWTRGELKRHLMDQIRTLRSYLIIAIYGDALLVLLLWKFYPDLLLWWVGSNGSFMLLGTTCFGGHQWRPRHVPWYPRSLTSQSMNLSSSVAKTRVAFNRHLGFTSDHVKALLSRVNDGISRNRGRYLVTFFLRRLSLIPLKTTKSWVKVLVVFSSKLNRLYKKGGMVYVVKYLKACHVLLQQSAGGQRHPATQDLGCAVSRNRRGVPRIIPAIHRQRLYSRPYLRMWLTIFSLYRILDCPGKLKLSTITEPGKRMAGEIVVGFQRFVHDHFWYRLSKLGDHPITRRALERKPNGKIPLVTPWAVEALQPKMFPILTAGAVAPKELGEDPESEDKLVSTAPWSLAAQAYTWVHTPEGKKMQPVLSEWVRLLSPPETSLQNLWHGKGQRPDPLVKQVQNTIFDLAQKAKDRVDMEEKVAKELKASKLMAGIPLTIGESVTKSPLRRAALGRLIPKPEPAGKIRVFAIVDAFTQWYLSPLHKAVFSMLRTIPQDGTFDQLAPISRLKLKKSSFVASYDLSAATDRLPLQLQKVVLQPLLGIHLAETWGDMLTKRGYKLNTEHGAEMLHYAVGQPMGALSSWALLALTHHAIVQYSAWQAQVVKPGQWFEAYALLGDDIMIANEAVANRYLCNMESIGVGIGLAKSLVSHKGTGEFAKRYFVPTDTSPMSPLESIVGLCDSANLMALIHRQKEYGPLTIANVLAFLGYGYKSRASVTKKYWNLPGRLRHYLLMLTFPDQPFGVSLDRWVQSLSLQASSKVGLKELYNALALLQLERLRSLLKAKLPYAKYARAIMMIPQYRKLSLKYQDERFRDPAWDLMSKIWTPQLEPTDWELAQCAKECERIALLHDPRERFVLLSQLEDKIMLIPFPGSVEFRRSSVGRRFTLLAMVRQWYSLRNYSSLKL